MYSQNLILEVTMLLRKKGWPVENVMWKFQKLNFAYSNVQNNTDTFSLKGGKDKNPKFKKKYFMQASLLSFFFFLIFLFQRWFEESMYSFVWPYRIVL